MNADSFLYSRLRQLRDDTPALPGYVYRNAADFVLQHGTFYHAGPFPSSVVKRGMPLQCFGNAIALAAMRGLRYVEGYSLSPTDPALVPIIHAWTVSDEGVMIDSTWLNHGLAYLGVEFAVERADEATWFGDASILQDHKHDFPLFQTRWQGEPPFTFFRTTKALQLIREGRLDEADQWLRDNT